MSSSRSGWDWIGDSSSPSSPCWLRCRLCPAVAGRGSRAAAPRFRQSDTVGVMPAHIYLLWSFPRWRVRVSVSLTGGGSVGLVVFCSRVTFSWGMSHLTAPSTALECIHIKHLQLLTCLYELLLNNAVVLSQTAVWTTLSCSQAWAQGLQLPSAAHLHVHCRERREERKQPA